MTRRIQKLAITEQAVIHVEALETLRNGLGDVPSVTVIERAAFEVSDRLVSLDDALMAGDLQGVAERARRLAGIADNLGMTKFAMIARDLASCVVANDLVAVASVSRRLMRVGEASVFQVIDVARDRFPA